MGASIYSQEMHNAVQLARRGIYVEATRKFWWCFDQGREENGFLAVRVSFLLRYINDLGQRYPPAMEDMKSRRDAIEALLLEGKGDHQLFNDLLHLNRVLNDSHRTIDLWHTLSEGTKSQRTLAELVGFLVDKWRQQH
jgi:hypothetical protein